MLPSEKAISVALKMGFQRIINCPRFRDFPLILETPYVDEEKYENEILLLKSMAEKDTFCA